MPLEATMIVLDNSEYMRNGDYQPSRFGALEDAVKIVFQTKIDSNPENTVGVMTMANKGCVRAFTSSFHTILTNDLSKP
jgi:26S proteasome regulatory subunit N10